MASNLPLTLGRKTSTNTDTAYYPTARSYPVPTTYARSPDPELQSQGRGRETPEQDFNIERGAYSREELRSTLHPRYRRYNPEGSFALPVRPPTRSRWGLDSHDPAAPSQPRGTWQPRELGKDRGIIEAAPALDESYEQRPDKDQSRQATNKSPRTLSTISDALHGEADNSLLSFANDPFQPQASDPQILSGTSPFQPRSLRSRNSFETTTTLSFLGGSQNHFNWLPPQVSLTRLSPNVSLGFLVGYPGVARISSRLILLSILELFVTIAPITLTSLLARAPQVGPFVKPASLYGTFLGSRWTRLLSHLLFLQANHATAGTISPISVN